MKKKASPAYFAQPRPLERGTVKQFARSLARSTPGMDSPRFVVGWREWLTLPDLGIPAIKAKIDTGARTSALHTHDYEFFRRGGKEMIRFHLHPLRRTDRIELTCEAEVLDRRRVKDSGGHPEIRPFISTTVRIGEFEWPIELSMTNRESMKFRMLVGRQALAGYFLVDSVKSYLLGGNLAKTYRR